MRAFIKFNKGVMKMPLPWQLWLMLLVSVNLVIPFFYLDRKRGIYYVSKIFDWFEEDFGDSTEGVLKFLRRYASEQDRKYVERNRVKVRYLTYDWTINSKPR